jgi:hypothetical protein
VPNGSVGEPPSAARVPASRWLVAAVISATAQATATAIVAFGALVSLAILVLAWRIRDPERALLAQAVAVACAVALITAASGVAVARGRRHTGGGRRLPHRAVRHLVVLIVCAVLGAVAMTLR